MLNNRGSIRKVANVLDVNMVTPFAIGKYIRCGGLISSDPRIDMFFLKNTLAAWASEDFAAILKAELNTLGSDVLPLQAGLRYASHISNEEASYMILNTHINGEILVVKLGVFYKGIVSGCSCADDPSPNTETNEYCVIELKINSRNAETEVRILHDET